MPLAGEVTEPLPVRRRLTVLRDGSIRASELVFCGPSGRSVPLSSCATCGYGGEVVRDASGCGVTVECGRFTLSSRRFQGTEVTRIASILPVGLILVRPVVCLSSDVPLRIALRALAHEESAYDIAVVDEQQRLVGTLPSAEATHVTTEWGSVDESASFGAAFGTMAARHAREVVVLGERRTFLGVVRDVDALRFVAHVSRTGSRPKVL
jgi:CBS domain-containing protein